jgi:DNA-binding transcriptional LysR family regulator
MMRGAEFAELRAFATIAQERSFRKAAARLGVTPSALSHVIRTLEARLGAKLLHRTTRSVAPTEAGAVLLGRLVPAMAEMERAVSEMGAFSDHPRGKLRLNVPRLAAEAVLIPKLRQFTQLYPDILLDLVIDDSMADIVAEGFDAGIRSGAHVHGDMIAVRLSPDLHEHRCINSRWGHDGAVHRWPFKREGDNLEIRVDPTITVNDTSLITKLALEGLGFAYILEEVVAEHLATGRLVRVLEDWCQPSSGFHLYYSGRRHLSAPLRAMIEFFRFESVSV